MKFGGRLGNLIMTRNNQTDNLLSSFAESAYAHAERSSSTHQRRRDQDNEDYSLLYYDDGTRAYDTTATVDRGQSNIVHAEFQPLAGSSLVVIANTSKNDEVTNARILKLMEERESIGCAIESMGGVWVSTLEDSNVNRTITHAIWIASEEDERIHPRNQLYQLSSETLVKLNTCLAMNIPVVSPNWLTKIGDLSPGQHWACDVDVENHIPRVIKLFYDINSGKSPPLAPIQSHPVRGSASSDSSRRDTASSLSASISDTYHTLIDENPDVVEEEALKRAMELSMLDFAIVRCTPTNKVGRKNPKKIESPYEILKVKNNASPAEIKLAYRRRALETHPDKGGKPGAFEDVARAYRMLLNAVNSGGLDSGSSRDVEVPLKSTAHWDTELKEHHNLVQELYQNHGQDLADHLQRQNFALEQLGLCQKDAGSQNYNEKHELIQNSCFYLSLASSYLSGIGALVVWDKANREENGDPDRTLLQQADDALIKETALQLKRVIEGAVLSAHPEWAAKGMVGEEVQAFSDFLVYILESQTIISDWAVVVFDTSSGFVDVYKGQNYKHEEEGTVDETYAASNTLTLRFVPGHYQPMMVTATKSSARPTQIGRAHV